MTFRSEASGNDGPNLGASEIDPGQETIRRLLGVIGVTVADDRYSSNGGSYSPRGDDFRSRQLQHPDLDGGRVDVARYLYKEDPSRRLIRRGYVRVLRDTGAGTGMLARTDHDVIQHPGELKVERTIPLPNLPDFYGGGGYFGDASDRELLETISDRAEAAIQQADDERQGLSRVTEQLVLDLISLVERATIIS